MLLPVLLLTAIQRQSKEGGKRLWQAIQTLWKLKKALGADYRIYNIDLERCLYRDYGNGFDIEISGVSRANRKCPATLYLWFTREGNPMIVKTVHNVRRTANAIAAADDRTRCHSG